MTAERGGWILRDMGGQAVTAGRTPQEAEERAEAMGIRPLRSRTEMAHPAALDALARELPLPRLGCEPGEPLWWRDEAASNEVFGKAALCALDLMAEVFVMPMDGMEDEAARLSTALNDFVRAAAARGRFSQTAPTPERRPPWLEDVATGEDLAALRKRIGATEDGLIQLAAALERRLP